MNKTIKNNKLILAFALISMNLSACTGDDKLNGSLDVGQVNGLQSNLDDKVSNNTYASSTAQIENDLNSTQNKLTSTQNQLNSTIFTENTALQNQNSLVQSQLNGKLSLSGGSLTGDIGLNQKTSTFEQNQTASFGVSDIAKTWFNTTTGSIKYWTGSVVKDLATKDQLGSLASLNSVTSSNISGTIPATMVQGLGSLATLSSINDSNIIGVSAGKVSGLGALASMNSVGAAQISSVAAASVTGQLADIQIAAMASSKLVGLVQDSQLAGMSSSKLTGMVQDSQLAGMSSSKLIGMVQDSQLTSVSSTKVTGSIPSIQISGLGTLATLNSITSAQVSDLPTVVSGATKVQTVTNFASSATVSTITLANSDSEFLLLDSTIGPIGVVLPAAPVQGRTFKIKDSVGSAGTGAITISTGSATLIDASATYSINAAYGFVELVYGGTRWSVMCHN